MLYCFHVNAYLYYYCEVHFVFLIFVAMEKYLRIFFCLLCLDYCYLIEQISYIIYFVAKVISRKILSN